MTGSKQRNNWPNSCGSFAPAARNESRTTAPRFAAFWRVTAALLCLGLTLTSAGAAATFEMPPLPTIKKRPERLHSPRGKELYSATAMAIVLPPKSYALVWNYRLPLPRDGVEFDIESRPDFQSSWVKIGTTNQPPYPITTTAPSGMFRVGAHAK